MAYPPHQKNRKNSALSSRNTVQNKKKNEEKLLQVTKDLNLQKLTTQLMHAVQRLQTLANNNSNVDRKVSEAVSLRLDIVQREFFRKQSKILANTHSRTQKPTTSPKNEIKPHIVNFGTPIYKNSTQTSCGTQLNRNSRAILSPSNQTIKNVDPLLTIRKDVQKAVSLRQIFTINGQYSIIRKALISREWIEKLHPNYIATLPECYRELTNLNLNDLVELLKKSEMANFCKTVIKSKIIGQIQPDLYWGPSAAVALKELSCKTKLPMVNKFRCEWFAVTNKQGLTDCFEIAHWYQKEGKYKFSSPRAYGVDRPMEFQDFIEDYHVTAAISLLNWIMKTAQTNQVRLLSVYGTIPLEVFEFALNECRKYIKKCNHEDIDVNIPNASALEWSEFLEHFYKAVHYNNHFHDQPPETEKRIIKKTSKMLELLAQHRSTICVDGYMNLWIMKPTYLCRGRGIRICRTFKTIEKMYKENPKIKYIVQKYIERPLLIYNTKFDIRQWFLISSIQPLTIWMYKCSYLRFGSQTYNLHTLHEAIHLTNNAIQKKYEDGQADAILPSYLMWSSHEFEDYLTTIGYPEVYKQIVYPEMKKCIIAVMLMNRGKMDHRINTFELFGADFILDETFKPWLLEVNANPAMSPTTPITTKFCPAVLEDVIKVVIDYKNDCRAKTGDFELIYQEQLTISKIIDNFQVKGIELPLTYFCNSPNDEPHTSDEKVSKKKIDDKRVSIKTLNEEIKSIKTLNEEIKSIKQDLLSIMHQDKAGQKSHARKK